jgi:TRAP-type transport system periplasmic protein
MRKGVFVACILAMLSLVFLGDGSSALAKPMKLKAVCFLPKNHPLAVMTINWVDSVNAALKDEVEIDYAGGPEVIPGMQQADAVKNGVVDIMFNVTAYFPSMLPEGWAFFDSKHTPTEERAPGGFYDFMVDRFKRINMMYLGRWLYSPFYLWTRKPVSRLEDLRGLKMRTAEHYDRFMKEMGIIPVTIMVSDVYTALERGTVDGFGWPLLGPRELGWTDTCKYIIDHPFHSPSNGVIVMNLGVWNKLSKKAQAKIIEISTEFEKDMVAHFQKADEEEWKKLDGIGIHRVHFPPEDAKKYIDIIYNVDWEILKERVPNLVPELKRVTGF